MGGNGGGGGWAVAAGGNGGDGWCKSTHSHSSGCVEVGRPWYGGEVWVRDSKDKHGPILAFTDEEWRAFLAGVRGGEFDLP